MKSNLLFPLIYPVLGLALALVGCQDGPESDAYGNFEATEITVSSEADGRLLALTVTEGDVLDEQAAIGLVDTTQLAAQKDNLRAQQTNARAQQVSLHAQERAARAQIEEARAQVDVWAAQLNTATEEHERTVRLASARAATERELNEREGAVEQLTARMKQALARVQSMEAQADVYAAQAEALDAQIASIGAQLRQIEDRIDRARLTNPRPGTVLTVLARAGEVVRVGSPLYTVADTDPLILRAYATGRQLPALTIGMDVDVLIDDSSGGLESRRGTITFIAREAEFTPTPIQTRDKRAELVYAFEVETPNPDGRLKIGMPGEVRFPE